MPEHAGIVTGASQGIGLAIARALAMDGIGLCLVAAPHDDERLAEVARELDAVPLAADVGDPETARRAVELTLERYGRLDRVASNAGIAYFEHVLDAPLEHFDHTMRVNVRGMYLVTTAAARHMATHGGGGNRLYGVDRLDPRRGAAGDLQRLQGRCRPARTVARGGPGGATGSASTRSHRDGCARRRRKT